jgi:Phage Mu protein F like protein
MITVKSRREVRNTHKLPTADPLRRELRDVYREQRNAILRFLRTGKKEQQADRLPWVWPSWDDFRLGALAISERMVPMLSATWDLALNRFMPRVGLDPDSMSVVNPHLADRIEHQAFNFCQSTNESTSDTLDVVLRNLRRELAEGIIEQGEALPEITKRVNQIFNLAEKKKAREIAQTETSRAVHSAQEQAAIHSGVVIGWRWLASADACDTCLAIVARCPTVRLGQPFAIIGHNPTYRHVKFPPAHPHCNCTVTEILDTDTLPKFHPTLDQPEPATDAEIDKINGSEMDRVNDIVRTWDPETRLYGSPLPPKPKRMKSLRTFRCNHR